MDDQTSIQKSPFSSANLSEFFFSKVSLIAERQSKNFSPLAIRYLTDLLTEFSEASRLFNESDGRVPVLADLLLKSLESQDEWNRMRLLRKLGDTSMMVSGYFPEALARRSIDIKYYRQMGEIAYFQLGSQSDVVNVFIELSENFTPLSEVVGEVAEETLFQERGIKELLSAYAATGEEKFFERLKNKGIIPLDFKKKP